jgi:hypothetical protein
VKRREEEVRDNPKRVHKFLEGFVLCVKSNRCFRNQFPRKKKKSVSRDRFFVVLTLLRTVTTDYHRLDDVGSQLSAPPACVLVMAPPKKPKSKSIKTKPAGRLWGVKRGTVYILLHASLQNRDVISEYLRKFLQGERFKHAPSTRRSARTATTLDLTSIPVCRPVEGSRRQ